MLPAAKRRGHAGERKTSGKTKVYCLAYVCRMHSAIWGQKRKVSCAFVENV